MFEDAVAWNKNALRKVSFALKWKKKTNQFLFAKANNEEK